MSEPNLPEALVPAAGSPEADEQLFHAEVQKNLKRNFTAHMLHGLLGQTGFRIVEAPTLVPAYVYLLSGSTTAVGVARACQALGSLLTPIIGATLIEHRRKVMPMVFGTGLGMRLPLLGIALAGFFLEPQATLIALCVLMAAFGFFQGMQIVTFSVLVAKVIPVERRGSLVGTRNSVAGLMASGVGLFSGVLIERNALGNGYASTFLIAFALTAAGLASLILLREPAAPAVRERSSQLSTRMRQLPALMRSDPGFRAYMIARSIGTMGRMATPYYVIYIGQVMHLSGDRLGMLTAAFVIAQTASALGWGLLGDRRGFRDVLLWSLAVWTVATVVLIYALGLTLVVIGFIALGAGMGGFQLGCGNLVLEFGKREDIAMRVALAQTAEQAVIVIAPLIGSLLIETVSYAAMFWTTAGVLSLASVVTALRVHEPRKPRDKGMLDANRSVLG